MPIANPSSTTTTADSILAKLQRLGLADQQDSTRSPVVGLLGSTLCRWTRRGLSLLTFRWVDVARRRHGVCRKLPRASIPAYVEVSRSGDGATSGSLSIPRVRQPKHGNLLVLRSRAPAHGTARLHFPRMTAFSRARRPTQRRLRQLDCPAAPAQAPDRGASVFVDDQWLPFPDQWALLAGVKHVPPLAVDAVLSRAARKDGVLGVRPVSFRRGRNRRSRSTLPPSRRQSELRIAGPMPHRSRSYPQTCCS